MPFASVRGPGHPDAACDAVARSLVDEYVKRDPESRCDIRVMGGHGALFITGEVRSAADFDAGAVATAVLSSIDPGLALEPFVSIERMDVPLLRGSSDPQAVFGYACDETPERLPVPAAYARRIASEIERLRRDDPDWYWCGADFDVGVSIEKKRAFGTVRLSHVPSIALDDLRMRTSSALSNILPELEWRVNPTGPDSRGGLAGRVGSSRMPFPGGSFGSALPSTSSGAGLHPTHPLNRGAQLAREAAAELVSSGQCHAAWVELTYAPDEVLPSAVRIRTDKPGFDVRFSREHFSLIIPAL